MIDQKYFQNISQKLFADLKGNEEVSLSLDAESTVYLRFNQAKIRQNTHVEQSEMTMTLQKDNKSLQYVFTLTHQAELDQKRALEFLQQARKEIATLPEDPYQTAFSNNGQSNTTFKGDLLSFENAGGLVSDLAGGNDFVGLYASGSQIRANQNSKGQNHWFQTESFFMDYSLFNGPKAVKSCYAGRHWQTDEFKNSLNLSKQNLDLLSLPLQSIKPGQYRVYMAPAAISEITSLLGWNALSYGAYKRGASAFKKLVDQEESFSPYLNLKENFKNGLVPRFNELGEVAPEEMNIIQNGKLENLMINTRSAKEYEVETNFASGQEAPRALEIGKGRLKQAQILQELDTGIYLSNLHYLNWSDTQNARITGMTRYACFWVEKGIIKGPIQDLRFDVSLYDIWGSQLMAITDFQEVQPSVDTYMQRSIGGTLLPGMLVDKFTFTL